MKYLVVLLVVGVVLWLMFGRRRGPAPKPPGRDAGAGPQPMVRCAHCGVHLPRGDALMLGERAYCSAAHRDAGAADR